MDKTNVSNSRRLCFSSRYDATGYVASRLVSSFVSFHFWRSLNGGSMKIEKFCSCLRRVVSLFYYKRFENSGLLVLVEL